jgi:hypothetical protein
VAHNLLAALAAVLDWSHSDSDNRPRYYVLAFMQRVE